MSSESATTREVLILSDDSGNMYAIPRDVLVNHKLTGEQKAAVEKELSKDDVEGFSQNQSAASGSLAASSNSANTMGAAAGAANNAAGASAASVDSFTAAYSNAAASSAAVSSSTGMLSGGFFNLNINLFGNSADSF